MRRLLSIWLRNWPIQRLQSEWRHGAWHSAWHGAAATLPEAEGTLADADGETSKADGESFKADGETFKADGSAPVILWTEDPRRGRLVVACCDRAAELGVRAGIAIAQATELVHTQLASSRSTSRRNGSALAPIAVEHDSIADSIAIERLAATLQTEISPMVAIETVGRRPWAGRVLNEPDTVFCDLTGVTHLFGDESDVLRATHRCLAELGITGKLAVADNAAAAWALAHFHPQPDFVSGSTEADLAGLSVDALRIETETKYTLDRLGVGTIGALMRLPRAGLARRLGEPLVNRIAESIGEIEVPLEMHHPSELVSADHDLEYPTDDFQILNDRLERLAAEIGGTLARRGIGALRIVCQFDLVEGKPLRTVIGLFSPTAEASHLAGLVRSSVETLRLPSEVCVIRLTVLQFGPLRTQQQSLFSSDADAFDESGSSDRSLARLVDTLTGRLGRDAVLGVRMSDNPLPEKAYRTYSLTDHRTRQALRRLPRKAIVRRSGGAEGRTPGRFDARRRPMKLLRKPIRIFSPGARRPASGPSLSGISEDGFPTFRVDGRDHRVLYHWGPERIETGWWDGPTIRRDYYRVETDSGHLWWVFRDLRSGIWFLQGRFA